MLPRSPQRTYGICQNFGISGGIQHGKAILSHRPHSLLEAMKSGMKPVRTHPVSLQEVTKTDAFAKYFGTNEFAFSNGKLFCQKVPS